MKRGLEGVTGESFITLHKPLAHFMPACGESKEGENFMMIRKRIGKLDFQRELDE